MMSVQCPSCKEVHQAPESMVGQQVQCKNCGATFIVPRQASAPATPAASAVPAVPAAPSAGRSPGGGLGTLFGGTSPQWAKLLFCIGMVLVVFSRGCDSVNQRGVMRARAKYSEALRQMDDSGSRVTEAELADLDEAADNAETNVVIWGYWLEWLFLLGSISLATGSAVIALTGTKLDRIVCLIVIAILVANYFFFGGLANVMGYLRTVMR